MPIISKTNKNTLLYNEWKKNEPDFLTIRAEYE